MQDKDVAMYSKMLSEPQETAIYFQPDALSSVAKSSASLNSYHKMLAVLNKNKSDSLDVVW